jgi:copper chaperone CopZ
MYDLNVTGMTCNHCVSRVTKAIKEVDPAAEFAVDLASGRVSVESRVDLEEIAAALDEAGYPLR